MRLKQLLTAGSLAILTASTVLSAAGTAGAATKVTPNMTPPPSGTHYISVSTALSTEKGKYYGPNTWTQGGRATITGFTKDSSGKYHRTLSMTQPPSPTIAESSPFFVQANTHGPTKMYPNSWYNPASWDWGHILGTSWSYMWDNCLKGATTGYIGAVGTNLATELLIKGALVTSWEGYAAVAFGGCVANFAIK